VAIDKDAVSKAIKTRYGEIMKSEEYLEKIFNISFNMPKHFELKNFINKYEFFNDENAEKLARFFEYIKFTRPRHIKKVLNKYEILTKFKDAGVDGGLIPEIITKNRDKYLFDTIFVLYFIILYEFYYEKYLEVKKYEHRVKHLKKIYTLEINRKYSINAEKTSSNPTTFKKESSPYFSKQILGCDMEKFIENIFLFENLMEKLRKGEDIKLYMGMINIFLSCVGDENIDETETNLTERYAKAGITVDFWEYIKNNYEDLIEEDYSNPYPFTNLFKMAETLL
jgi:hypothetical protein